MSLFVNFAFTHIDVKGTLKIDGNVKVEMSFSYAPAIGDEFRLWKAEKFSGNPTIELPSLPDGLEWDATGLKDGSGVLRVAVSSGVGMIAADEPVKCYVYDMLGVCMGSVETTKADAANDVRNALNPDCGVYVLRLVGREGSETVKVRL